MWWNSTTQILTKLKKKKLWQNLKTQMGTELKNWNGDKTQNSNGDKTEKLKIVLKKNEKNSNCVKIHIVTKLQLWQNSNCYKTQKFKYDNSHCNKTQQIQLWPNKKSKIVTKLKKIRLALEPPEGQYAPEYPQGFSTYYHSFVIPH